MDFIIISLVKIIVVLLIILTTVANLVYMERRISAFIQNRIGPNRVGPWGLLQAPADVLKLFIKEDIVPAQANHFVHTLAPIISITVALSTFAVVPFGNTITLFGTEIRLMIADANVGILYILAMTSMGVYGLTL
ncbi:MAG: nuoH, partial [Bacteroidetes bacterium]|nr:nuoH [Bacteroidota bacterium]